MNTPQHIELPTVGRRVHFHANGADLIGQGIINHDFARLDRDPQPMDAGIAYVFPPPPTHAFDPMGAYQLVNISLFDHNGNHHGMVAVPFRQPHEPVPDTGRVYVEWMPYQNKKHQQEATVSAASLAGLRLEAGAVGGEPALGTNYGSSQSSAG